MVASPIATTRGFFSLIWFFPVGSIGNRRNVGRA
jgi:hypothetical protein